MKKLRYLIEGIILHVLFFIFRLMPVDMASNTGGWIGSTIGPRLAASRKAMNNLKTSLPEKTDEEYNGIIKGMWDNLGRIIAEYPHLKTIGHERTTFKNAEIIVQYKDKPCIMINGHLGNWEVSTSSAYLQHNFKITPIYRAPNNPITDKLLLKCRSMNGKIDALPKSRGGTRQIIQTLQDNGHIGMLIDQKYNEGVEALFFGRPAMTSPIYVQLAQKFDCPIIPARIIRTKGANFIADIQAPMDIEGKDVDTVIKESHDILEGWIKEYPEQWLWLHKRWK